MEIKRVGSIEEGDRKVGNETLVRVVKNKVAPPFKEARFDIIYGKGIARPRELLKLGEQLGIIKKSGSWFSFGATQLGQGSGNSAAYLEEHREIAEQLEQTIRQKAGLPFDKSKTKQPSLLAE
jgi:recombination protein RecA